MSGYFEQKSWATALKHQFCLSQAGLEGKNPHATLRCDAASPPAFKQEKPPEKASKQKHHETDGEKGGINQTSTKYLLGKTKKIKPRLVIERDEMTKWVVYLDNSSSPWVSCRYFFYNSVRNSKFCKAS